MMLNLPTYANVNRFQEISSEFRVKLIELAGKLNQSLSMAISSMERRLMLQTLLPLLHKNWRDHDRA